MSSLPLPENDTDFTAFLVNDIGLQPRSTQPARFNLSSPVGISNNQDQQYCNGTTPQPVQTHTATLIESMIGPAHLVQDNLLAPELDQLAILHPLNSTTSQSQLNNEAAQPEPQVQTTVPFQRKLEVQRRAQKRFRERKKNQAQELQDELAKTKAELERLKAEQHQHKQQQQQQHGLQCKTLLLSRLCRTADAQASDTDDLQENVLDLAGPGSESAADGILVSLPGRQQFITTQALRAMTLSNFAVLWTDYIREIGQLLVELETAHDSSTQTRLEDLTTENNQLMGCLQALNPAVLKAGLQKGLDVSRKLPPSSQLDSAFFNPHNSIHTFTESQLQDFLHLRRLFLTRKALLSAEKEIVISQLTNSTLTSHSPHVDRLSSGLDLSKILKQYTLAEYRIFLQIAFVARRGLCTTVQWAMLMVHAYPFLPALEKMFESLADQYNAPSIEDVQASAVQFPMDAEWAAFEAYIAGLIQNPDHDWVPLTRQDCQENVRAAS